MEKLYVGWQMSTRWTDPTLVLFMLLPISIGWIWGTGYCLYCECYRMYLPVPSVIVYIIFQLWMWDTEEVNTKKYIVWFDENNNKSELKCHFCCILAFYVQNPK